MSAHKEATVSIVTEDGTQFARVTPSAFTRAGAAYAAGRAGCLAGKSITYIPANTDMIGWLLGFQEARPDRPADVVVESDANAFARWRAEHVFVFPPRNGGGS